MAYFRLVLVRLISLTLDQVSSLSALEPYGAGHRRPVFAATDILVVGEPRIIGRTAEHISFDVAQGTTRLRAVGFNLASRRGELHPGRFHTIVFSPILNEWMGRTSVELHIKDFAG